MLNWFKTLYPGLAIKIAVAIAKQEHPLKDWAKKPPAIGKKKSQLLAETTGVKYSK